MRKTLIASFFLLLLASSALGQSSTSSSSNVTLREEDGSPSFRARVIKVSDGTLTDNGDGSGTIITGAILSASSPLSGTGTSSDPLTVDLTSKQDTLISATNIKTVNGTSLLGSGNVVVTGTSQWLDNAGSVIYYSSGNVGIGSAAPQALLDVEGSIYALNSITAGSYSSTATTLRGISGGSSAVRVDNFGTGIVSVEKIDPVTKVRTDGQATLVVDGTTYTNGNIGIGSSSPIQKLDVEGSVYVLTSVGIGSSSPRPALDVNGTIYGTDAILTGNLEVDSTLYIGDIAPTIKRQNSPLQVQSVALGTTPFNIFNAANYQIFTVQEGAAGAATMEVRNATATANIQLNSTWHSYFNTGSSSGFIIGGTTPTAKLDVGGFSRTSLGSTIDGTTNASIGVRGSVEIDTSLYVDTSIYLTAPDTGSAGGFYISQPDGGCSKCGVDNAGTTWSCTNITCPTGM